MPSPLSTGLDFSWSAFQVRFALRPEIALLYDRRTGIEHRLNATALSFFRALAVHDDRTACVRALSNEHHTPEETIHRDIEHLLQIVLEPAVGAVPLRKSGAPSDWAAVDVPFPLVLEIELTKTCNWACDFCYNVWKVDDRFVPVTSDKHLSTATIARVFDEAAAAQCLRIRISGGEPTLHPDFDAIMKRGASYGFDFELFTNGSRITPGRADLLAECGTRVLLVSLHGGRTTHTRIAVHRQSYDHALEAMRLAQARGIVVMAETLISAENATEIPDIAAAVAAVGVKHLSLMPYVPFSSCDPRRPLTLRQIQEAIAQLRRSGPSDLQVRVPCAPRHCLEDTPISISNPVALEFDNHCAAGILWASIAYDGRVRHCPHSNVYAGHVEEGIGEIWRQRILPTVRRVLEPRNDACRGCGQFSACQGGCHLTHIVRYPVEGKG